MAVERVRPTKLFKHDVEVQLPNEQGFRTISIVGPRLCGKIRLCDPATKGSLTKQTTYNWYKIVATVGEKIETPPLYFLTPATVLGRSEAEGEVEGANILLAVASNTGQEDNRIQRSHQSQEAEFFLRPVMQRHHDEIYPINKPPCSYVVRTTGGTRAGSGEIHTVDQFGLHHAKRLSTPYRVDAASDF